ncbi:MAG: hypothetical protein EAX81_08575, partial [Candidatus Thorarchaeota archaeon]|nr:hypothetical protein [Candidatus Thorarchaeota archaeon]
MVGGDASEQRAVEMEKVLHPSIIIVLFPVICIFMAALFLTTLPWLIGAYNYLRGMSSPIDQAVLALLGSDSSRLVVLASCIIGVIIGLYLSHFVTTKLDVLKREGKAELGMGMYIALFSWWMFPLFPVSTISSLEMIIYGSPMSHFLSDLGYFMMAGYFLGYSIPVLWKYAFLALYTSSIDSQIILVGLPKGSGSKRRFQSLTL